MVNYTYPKKIICGNCFMLERIGSSDTGRCSITEQLHDIMDRGCEAHFRHSSGDHISDYASEDLA